MNNLTNKTALVALVGLVLPAGISVQTAAAQGGTAGCSYIERYMAPFDLAVKDRPVSMIGPGPEVIKPREVGPTACQVVHEEVIQNVHGKPFNRIILGMSGTLFGFVTENPPRDEQFSDQFLTIGRANQWGPYFPGVYTYQWSEDTPAEIEMVFPQNAADWNGKLWVLAHGVSYYSTRATYPDRKPGEFTRYLNQAQFAAALIDDGYAIAYTRRGGENRSSTRPVETALTDDGRTFGGEGKVGMAINNNTSIIRDWTVVAENFLAEKLGKAPEATFFRGHSAGAAIGRSFNSIPGWNVDHAGNKLFDGIFLSDTASGRGPLTWFLKAEVGEGGKTTLVETDVDAMTFDEEHRAGMAKTIETMHASYIGGDFVHTDWNSIRAGEDADRVIPSYTELKRDLARILVEKGLNTDLWRFYEIADVGHNDAANERNTWPENAAEMVDVGGVYLPLKRALDRWATKNAEPPASRTDARDVAELDKTILPQIRLPETACPRGFFHPYVARPGGKTSDSHQYFVPYHTVLHEQINAIEMDLPEGFDQAWLEPLDVNGFLVDVSGEGTRNTKLTIEQAWHARYRNSQETGILRPYEELTRARYASCVNEVAQSLYDGGLLSDEARDWYRWKGLKDPIMDDSAPLSANDCSAWESLGFKDEAQCTGFISTGEL